MPIRIVKDAQSILSGQDPVVITGVGTITTAGVGVASLWSAAIEGRTAGTWLKESPGIGRALAVCEAPAITHFPEQFRQLRHLDRSAQLAWVAANEAVLQAELGEGTFAPERIGVVVGTSRGPQEQWATAMEQFSRQRVRPTAATHGTISSLSGALSLAFQARGPNFTLSAACASGAVAITQAAEQLILGHADVMIAGGTEAPLHPVLMAQLLASGILGEHTDPRLNCRPFDRDRNGTIIGEGAGFLVLERQSGALRRGVKPLATISGWALGTDARGRAAGDASGEGLARILTSALQRAGISMADIGYANLHGTGTVLNDNLEAAAFRQFGAVAAGVACGSTKPVTGHCLGATSAIEAILCTEAMRQQVLPPSPNCQNPDPDCSGLNLLQKATPAPAIRHTLSLSSGFWSNHAALILSAWRP